mgnify:FL=1
MTEQLQNYPVVIELPILWGHMDAFQHVNNIMFFRFFESARIAYFERIGFLDTMERTGIGPILASTRCKYISPSEFLLTFEQITLQNFQSIIPGELSPIGVMSLDLLYLSLFDKFLLKVPLQTP